MIRASQILFWFGLSIAASLALYHTSDQVHELNRQLRSINERIDTERQTMHVLKAEWAYLSTPARMEDEAHRHLSDLHATKPQQVINFADLGDSLPTHAEEMASVDVEATPIATIASSMPAPPMPKPLSAAHKIAVAENDSGRINNRMIIQHAAPTQTASAQSSDQIAALIGSLGKNR